MSTQRLYARAGLPELFALGGILLALAGLSGAVTYALGPLFVPLMAVAMIGGAVVIMRPELGVYVMFAMILFKPEAIQGLGILGPNMLISAVLAGILFLTVSLGGSTEFLRSNQLRAFLILGLLLTVNWFFVGRLNNAPTNFADLDTSGRTLYRYAVQLAFMVFVIAFVRTPRQLLALTGVFILGIFATIPGALATRPDAATATKVEALRAVAVSGGVQAAENANRLAFMCLMGIAIIWFALLRYRSLIVRAFGAAVLLALILTIFRTGSRSGLLNLVLLVVLLAIQTRMNPGYFGVLAVAGMIGVIVVLMFVPEGVLQRITAFDFFNQEGTPKALAESNTRRLTVLFAGLKLASQNPFMGVGIGNFRWMTALDYENGGIIMAAHNAYLLAIAEGGVVLLTAYLFFFWITGRDLNRTLRKSAQYPEVGLQWLILATRTNLILLMVFALFAEAWKEFFYLLIVCTAAVLGLIYDRAAADRAKAAPA